MRYSYRITKYLTSNEVGHLTSNLDEWTSYSEVGSRVTMKDYLIVEDSYLLVIKATCDYLRVNSLKLIELEIYDGDNSILNNQNLAIEDAIAVARKALREELWCKLVSTTVEFHFGYDFYLYITSNNDLSCLYTHKSFSKLLNIEEKNSPYS